MHKFSFHNKFIIYLYMFRALLCSSSGGQNCVIQHLVSSHPVGGRTVHRCRPPTECDDTRCCIIQFRPPDDEHKSGRNMWRNIINLFETRICALSWLIAKIILRFTVRKTLKKNLIFIGPCIIVIVEE